MRFSIIIPTYQRRDLVRRMVAALGDQTHDDFEVIVVVDGSTDGTAVALRELGFSFPLRVLEQINLGAAAARNAGAAAADGELFLFLDDDMEADPALLAEHERSHREGADMVLGDLPLHPDSPPTAISLGVGRWAARRRHLLASPGIEVPLTELLTGQMSISRDGFERIGGFDVSFTRDGLFGGEDIDFGYRVRKAGLRVVFNPAAVSSQYYAVDPAAFTRRSREAGRAAQELSMKHPELADQLAHARQFATRRSRIVFGTLALAPPVLSWPLRAIAIRLVRSGRLGVRTNRLFFVLQTTEYLRGARQAQAQFASGRAVVLAYHAISDLRGDPVLAEYGVPPLRFASQLDGLAKRGRRFVNLEVLLRALNGDEPLPARAVLVTFDDCYLDLLTAGVPALRDRAIPAVAFAVAGHTGGTNEWDRPLGARTLRLLDAEALRTIAANGIVVGSHGATHRRLVGLEPAELEEELRGSAKRLAALDLPSPVAFSYPYGQWNPEIAAAVSEAGYSVAFTVDAGAVRLGGNRYALPRIEVSASDTARTLRLKVATAHWPDRWRRRVLRLLRVRQ